MTYDLEHDLWPEDDIYQYTLIVCYISAHGVIQIELKAKKRNFDLILTLFSKTTYDHEHDLWTEDDFYQ